MTDKLVQRGTVTSPAVEAAFRTVPRHAFALPGTLTVGSQLRLHFLKFDCTCTALVQID